jgi:hypothetical protein
MAFNIAEGMLLVAGPWLAKTQLPGGPQTLGLLLAALSAGEAAGAAAAGARRPRTNPLTAIAIAQIVAATGFLAVLAAPHTLGVAAGFLVIGLFSAPMTVWAQSLRMERIPGPLRGRAFATLRTLMQATPPIGAALATPILQTGRLGLAALAMTLLSAAPALALLPRPRRPKPIRLVLDGEFVDVADVLFLGTQDRVVVLEERDDALLSDDLVGVDRLDLQVLGVAVLHAVAGHGRCLLGDDGRGILTILWNR